MQSTQIDKINLVQEIQNILKFWIDGKPETRSVAYIARETGVSDSAIRRLMNNSIKITDDSIFKLLSYISNSNSFESILEFFSSYPSVGIWINRNYSFMKNYESLQKYRHSSLAEEVTIDALTYSIYMLVASVPNISTQYIKDQYGLRGEFELEKLIEKQFITVHDGILRAKEQKLKITREQTINLLPDITKLYLKKDHIYNARALEIESVSKAGYIKLMDLYERFLGEVSTTLNNNPGDIPVVVAGFFDSLTTQPYFEEKKHETSH